MLTLVVVLQLSQLDVGSSSLDGNAVSGTLPASWSKLQQASSHVTQDSNNIFSLCIFAWVPTLHQVLWLYTSDLFMSDAVQTKFDSVQKLDGCHVHVPVLEECSCVGHPQPVLAAPSVVCMLVTLHALVEGLCLG